MTETPATSISVKPIEMACTRERFVGRVQIETGLCRTLLEKLSAAFDRSWDGTSPRFPGLRVERDTAHGCYVMSGPLGKCCVLDEDIAYAANHSAVHSLLDSAAIYVSVYDRGPVRVIPPPIVIY